jgi:hypothetical protein
LAVFPVIALFANNIEEVSPSVIWRPLFLTLLAALLSLLVVKIPARKWNKAILITSLLLILFFSFGHLYGYLKRTPLVDLNIVRYRYLSIIYLLFLIAGCWLIIRAKHISYHSNIYLNIFSALLLVYPLYEITSFSLSQTNSIQSGTIPAISHTSLDIHKNPDVYYFILDSYARADSIQKEFGYDNTQFLEDLEARGFYVAKCSRSNYPKTSFSLASSLNMAYYPDLIRMTGNNDAGNIKRLIKQNLTRSYFKDLGYQIVSFDTGYEWSRWKDADLYLHISEGFLTGHSINPFEYMLLDSTPIAVILDMQNQEYFNQYTELNHPKSYFINLETFILNETPAISKIDSPTFAFIHVMIPHPPMVFSPLGILTDPGYFSGNGERAVNDEYLRQGYIYEIQYINEKMLTIVDQIIENSTSPPIILIQGDHGIVERDPIPILNAYYLPGGGSSDLYPLISPVNTFRVILNRYFGANLELLPDESFHITDIETPVQENMPDCIIAH